MVKKQKFAFKRFISLLASAVILIHTAPSATNATDFSPHEGSETVYDDSGGNALEGTPEDATDETPESGGLVDTESTTPNDDTESITIDDTNITKSNILENEAPTAIDSEQDLQSSQAVELFNLSMSSGNGYSVVVTNESGDILYNDTYSAGSTLTLTGKMAINDDEAGSHTWSSDNTAAATVKLESNYTGRYGVLNIVGEGRVTLTHRYLNSKNSYLEELFYVSIEIPTILSLDLPVNSCTKTISITNGSGLIYLIATEASAVSLPISELTDMAAGDEVNVWISYEDSGTLFYLDGGLVTLSGTVYIDAHTGFSEALDHITIMSFAAATIADISLEDVYYEQANWSSSAVSYTDAIYGQASNADLNWNSTSGIYAVHDAPISFSVTIDGDPSTLDLNCNSVYPENTFYSTMFDNASAIRAAFGLEPQTVEGLDGEYYNLGGLNIYLVAQAADGFILNFTATPKPINHTTLQITKNVSGLTKGNYEFTFTVSDDTFYMNMFSLIASVGADGSGSASLTLANIEPGTYTVTESGDYKSAGSADDLVWSSDTSNDTARVDIAFNDNANVTINNNYRERVTSSLIISKSVSYNSSISSAPISDSFDFYIEIDGAPYVGTYTLNGSDIVKNTADGSITLKSGETVVIDGIDVGSTYMVTENLSAEQQKYYTSLLENANGILNAEPAYISATSTYFNSLTTTISGNLTWVDGEGNNLGSDFTYYPASVTIQLCEDDIATGKTYAVATDMWAYSFDGLPQYNADGSEINYSIKEAAIFYDTSSNYRAKLDGNGFVVYLNDSGQALGMWQVQNGLNTWIPAQDEGSGSFSVYLSDGSKPLSGAVFTLDGKEEGTDTSGYASFDNLPAGTYQLTQTSAPNGYLTDSTIWTVTVGDGGTLVSVSNTDGGSGIWTNLWNWLVSVTSGDSKNLLDSGNVLSVTNTRATGNLNISLEIAGLDEELQPDLTITLSGIDGSITGGVLYQLKRSDDSYADGTWMISGLPIGQYQISQSGAQLIAYELTAEFGELVEVTTEDCAITIKNTYTEKLSGETYYTTAELLLNVFSDDGKYLSGAGFTVYDSYEDAEADTNALASVTTSKGGKASLLFGGNGIIQNGMGMSKNMNTDLSFSFFLKETVTPAGYSISSDIHEITVSENYRTALSEDGKGFYHQYTYSVTAINGGDNELATLSIENARLTSGISITKKYSGVSGLPDSFAIRMNGNDELTDGLAYTLTLDNAEHSGGNYIWRLTEVPTGRYSITEDGAELSGYNMTSSYMVDGLITRDTEVNAGWNFSFTIVNTYVKSSDGSNNNSADDTDYSGSSSSTSNISSSNTASNGTSGGYASTPASTVTADDSIVGSSQHSIELPNVSEIPAGIPSIEFEEDTHSEPAGIEINQEEARTDEASSSHQSEMAMSNAAILSIGETSPSYNATSEVHNNNTNAPEHNNYDQEEYYTVYTGPETEMVNAEVSTFNSTTQGDIASTGITGSTTTANESTELLINKVVTNAVVAGSLVGGVSGSLATLVISKRVRRRKIES